MIVLPLLPDFPQEWDKDGGGNIGAVIVTGTMQRFTMETISYLVD